MVGPKEIDIIRASENRKYLVARITKWKEGSQWVLCWSVSTGSTVKLQSDQRGRTCRWWTGFLNSCRWLLAFKLYFYLLVLVATGFFFAIYHCRVSAHACGFNLLSLHLTPNIHIFLLCFVFHRRVCLAIRIKINSTWETGLPQRQSNPDCLVNRPLLVGGQTIGDLVSKETVSCVGGKVKHSGKLSTTRSIR